MTDTTQPADVRSMSHAEFETAKRHLTGQEWRDRNKVRADDPQAKPAMSMTKEQFEAGKRELSRIGARSAGGPGRPQLERQPLITPWIGAANRVFWSGK